MGDGRDEAMVVMVKKAEAKCIAAELEIGMEYAKTSAPTAHSTNSI